MTALLEQEIADYTARRDRLVEAIHTFIHWLDAHEGVDGERNLRLLDSAEALQRDRLTLAFVAEYSRGKSELINALFFADHRQRLLPSDAGRTTMCPTEIAYDPQEESCLKLLPIETRLAEEAIAHLKLKPVEWVKLKLDPENREEWPQVLLKLRETRRVPPETARALGLLDPQSGDENLGEDGCVDIPAWRYALLNLPHPLLEAGLVLLDTPGLNALGSEPELTLSAIPNAHAIIFLLAADAGVTRSDLEIWQKYVHKHVNFHVAVLNKIDTLWDEMKPAEEIRAGIERQVQDTARILKLPLEQVFALSARSALVGRVKQDADLLARSGVLSLEHLLAHKIIPARREILCHTTLHDMEARLAGHQARLAERAHQVSRHLVELSQLSGKNRDMVQQLRDEVMQEKERYEATAERFRHLRAQILRQGEELLGLLSKENLSALLADAMPDMESAWTTGGLTGAMRRLAEGAHERFARASRMGHNIQGFLHDTCERFVHMHGFKPMQAPALDLQRYRQRMEALVREAEDFCRDPTNLVLEKRFMIRRFIANVVQEAVKTYSLAAQETDRWLQLAITPITVRVREHKQILDERLDNLKKILANTEALQGRMLEMKQELAELKLRRTELEDIAHALP